MVHAGSLQNNGPLLIRQEKKSEHKLFFFSKVTVIPIHKSYIFSTFGSCVVKQKTNRRFKTLRPRSDFKVISKGLCVGYFGVINHFGVVVIYRRLIKVIRQTYTS